MATIVICLILVVICIVGIRSMINRTAHGCCGGGGDNVKKVKVKDKNVSHYPYTCTVGVSGMTCSNCKKRVENAFNEKEGVYAVVDIAKAQAVIHMKEKMPEDEIMSTNWQSGYEPDGLKFS